MNKILTILITGSRDWQYPEIIEAALVEMCNTYPYGKDSIHIVHGDCPMGADRIAKDWAHMFGVMTTAIPAQWAKYGLSAGPIRNQLMVDIVRNTDNAICFAFIRGNSKGASGCFRMAKMAGIWWAAWRDNLNSVSLLTVTGDSELVHNIPNAPRVS